MSGLAINKMSSTANRASLEKRLAQVGAENIAVKVVSPSNGQQASVGTGNLVNNNGQTKIWTAKHVIDPSSLSSSNPFTQNVQLEFYEKGTKEKLGQIAGVAGVGSGKHDVAAIETGLKLPNSNIQAPQVSQETSQIKPGEKVSIEGGFKGGQLRNDRMSTLEALQRGRIRNNIVPANMQSGPSLANNIVPTEGKTLGKVALKGGEQYGKGDSGVIGQVETQNGRKAAYMVVEQEVTGQKTLFAEDLGRKDVRDSLTEASELAKQKLGVNK